MHLSAGQTGRVHDKKCKVFERSKLGLGRVSHLALATHYQRLLVAVSCESCGCECNDCRKQTGAWLKLSEVKRLAGTWGYFNSFFLEATRGLNYCRYPDCQTCLCKVWSEYLLSVISP